MKREKQIVDAESNQIKKLMFDEHLYDRQIIKKLNIPESTFYWHKKRIYRQEAKQWKPDTDIVKTRVSYLQKVLEDGLKLNERIRDSEDIDPDLAMQAAKDAAVFAAHLVKLGQEGLTINMYPEVKARLIETTSEKLEAKTEL